MSEDPKGVSEDPKGVSEDLEEDSFCLFLRHLPKRCGVSDDPKGVSVVPRRCSGDAR